MSRDPKTIAVRAGVGSDPTHGAVMPPLVTSSNFTFAALGEPRRYDYTRSGNPTRTLLAETLTELEGGAGAIVTASGMAAVTAVLQLVPVGARIVACHDGYGGTHRLLRSWHERGLFEVEWADLTAPETIAALEEHPPALVWLESPSNPLLRITDIRTVRAALPRTTRLVVDNTFLSPILQRPIELGADLVVHSTTKLINGHSDVVGGAVVAATPELAERLEFWCNALGLAGSPFDAWLTQRGLRTIVARIEQQQRSAGSLALELATHPAVRRVYYPGLPHHSGHTLARSQQSGFGTMLSFELEEEREAIAAFCEALETFSLAESLGGVESLICHPATMTHAAMVPEARRRAGIEEGLLRLSIGLEPVEALVADLERAFERYGQVLATKRAGQSLSPSVPCTPPLSTAATR